MLTKVSAFGAAACGLILVAVGGPASAYQYHGDESAEVVSGTSGADQMWGWGGDDQLSGLEGPDLLDGGSGHDDLAGGMSGAGAEESDQLYGGKGDDVLHGNGGVDALVPGSGSDEVFGGNGDDSVLVAPDPFMVMENGIVKYSTHVDVIDCGSGSGDQVVYSDALDPKDSFVGCESFKKWDWGRAGGSQPTSQSSSACDATSSTSSAVCSMVRPGVA